jgi:hypothetical protein
MRDVLDEGSFIVGAQESAFLECPRMELEFFDGYHGESTEQLLGLEGSYRIDSLVCAFEQAIMEVATRRPISTEERAVLAVEALEREVNNGGYHQFFSNSSLEFVGVIEQALVTIGCQETARITLDAIAALEVTEEITGSRVEAAIVDAGADVLEALECCDKRYYANPEPIADLLFAWIKQNQAAIRVGAGRLVDS